MGPRLDWSRDGLERDSVSRLPRLAAYTRSSRDFRLHFDPVYGNCYTFNYNITSPLKNTRAGPTHGTLFQPTPSFVLSDFYAFSGLRLLLNVNQTDYLPFTEAAGVRIVIHEQDHFPFPDSLGYSAPTGMISSFGLKCVSMHSVSSFSFGRSKRVFSKK